MVKVAKWLQRAAQEIKDVTHEREICGTCGNQRHAGRSDCWYCDGSPWDQDRR